MSLTFMFQVRVEEREELIVHWNLIPIIWKEDNEFRGKKYFSLQVSYSNKSNLIYMMIAEHIYMQ